ncbi:MAG: hypothetical protein KAS12_03730 [Candidatus Aenigmarchaeota archaeon]|nr:hypothetical protein [Candidatus Aenigmarchaeota archaeon]
MKKILLIIIGLLIMAFGVYGLIVWWWPLFVKVFLGLLGLTIFFVGLILFFVGLEN